jgi:hypothetical protein
MVLQGGQELFAQVRLSMLIRHSHAKSIIEPGDSIHTITYEIPFDYLKSK